MCLPRRAVRNLGVEDGDGDAGLFGALCVARLQAAEQIGERRGLCIAASAGGAVIGIGIDDEHRSLEHDRKGRRELAYYRGRPLAAMRRREEHDLPGDAWERALERLIQCL